MLRSSSTGEPTDGTRASWGGMDDLEEATTQKSSNTHSGTEIEHPLSRTSIPPIRAFRSSGNRRRQHLGPTEYTVFGTTTVPLSLISSSGRCPADPLRAIERSSIAALTFCWSYVRDFSQPGPLPTFLSKYDHDQVSNACMCFYGPGVLYSSLALPTTTTSLPQTSSLPPKVRSLPTRTSRSLSSPDPATEDATYARPSEYHGAEPTSEATITATVQGPTSVPDPGRRTQRQSLSALLMPNPATEDATYSRPHEYYGPDPTSEATITAGKSHGAFRRRLSRRPWTDIPVHSRRVSGNALRDLYVGERAGDSAFVHQGPHDRYRRANSNREPLHMGGWREHSVTSCGCRLGTCFPRLLYLYQSAEVALQCRAPPSPQLQIEVSCWEHLASSATGADSDPLQVIVPFAVVLGLVWWACKWQLPRGTTESVLTRLTSNQGDSCQRGDKYKCFVTYFSILEIRFE